MSTHPEYFEKIAEGNDRESHTFISTNLQYPLTNESKSLYFTSDNDIPADIKNNIVKIVRKIDNCLEEEINIYQSSQDSQENHSMNYTSGPVYLELGVHTPARPEIISDQAATESDYTVVNMDIITSENDSICNSLDDYISQANIFYEQNDYNEAINILKQGLKISRDHESYAKSYEILEAMSTIYMEIGDTTLARHLMYEALRISKTMENIYYECRAYKFFADQFTPNGPFGPREGAYYIAKYMELGRIIGFEYLKHNNPDHDEEINKFDRSITGFYTRLARDFEVFRTDSENRRREPDNSDKFRGKLKHRSDCDQSKVIKPVPFSQEPGFSILERSKYWIDQGNFELAISYLERGVILFKQSNDCKRETKSYYYLSKCYRGLGNSGKAIEYAKKHHISARILFDRDELSLALDNILQLKNDMEELEHEEGWVAL